jgi:hypothetical protein
MSPGEAYKTWHHCVTFTSSLVEKIILVDDPPREVIHLFLRHLVKTAYAIAESMGVENPAEGFELVTAAIKTKSKTDGRFTPHQRERVLKYFHKGWYEQYLTQEHQQ